MDVSLSLLTLWLAQKYSFWAYAGMIPSLHQSPNILCLHNYRAGKTSIQQVLFNNLPPKQTFYLETTLRIVKHHIESVLLMVSLPSWYNRHISTVIPLEVWDCPANITVETLGVPLSQFATIIFVIDIRVSPFCHWSSSLIYLSRTSRIYITSPYPSS